MVPMNISSENSGRNFLSLQKLRDSSSPGYRLSHLFLLTYAVFIFLALWKYDRLLEPPYGEYAETIWTEASFLLSTNFDYFRLFFKEGQIEEGGVRSFSISIMPTLFAITTLAFGPPSTHALFHLLTIACYSIMLTYSLATLSRRVGVPLAIFIVASLFTTPCIQSHIEMLSIDPIMGVMLLGIAESLRTHRPLIGCLFAALAFFVKPSSAPATLALSITCMIGAYFERLQGPQRKSALLIGWMIATLLILTQVIAIKLAAHDAQIAVRTTFIGDPRVFIFLLVLLAPYYIPILLLVMASFVRLIFDRKEGPIRAHSMCQRIIRRNVARLRRAARHDQELMFSFLYVAILFASFFSFMFVPRYLLTITPFLCILVAEAIGRRGRLKTLGIILLFLLLINNVINTRGSFLIPLPKESIRDWGITERSMAYRDDLEGVIAAAKFLSDLASDEPIVAGKLMTQIGSSNDLGYVSHSLTGYTVLDKFSIGRWRHLSEMLTDRPASVIVVSITTTEYAFPPPSSTDEILFHDNHTRPLIIYRKRFNLMADPSAHETWIADLIRANKDPYIRSSVLLSSGLTGLTEADINRRVLLSRVGAEEKKKLSSIFARLGEPLMAELLLEPKFPAKH
jgi:hypothetical protein